MKVKQRLRINTALMALSVIALIAVLIITSQRVGRVMEQMQIADALITTSFERLALRTDYMRTGSERAREQVRAKNEQVHELLKSASEKFTDTGDKKMISALIEGHESIGKIFRAIVANRQNTGPEGRNAALSGEIEDRLLSQLNMRAYEAVLISSRLQDSRHAALVSSLSFGSGWIAFVLLLMGAAILINSWTLNRAITDRVTKLRYGASVLGEGTLDYRIDIEGNDEFADLARAFNETALKLRGSYHDLEDEIAERKQAEKAVRESEEQFRTLADSIPNLAWWANDDGYITWYNRRWYDYTGTTHEQMEGWGWQSVHDPAVLPVVLERWQASLATGEPFDMEFPLRGADGVFRPFLTRVLPLKDSAGRVIRWFGTNTDVSERKRAEEALKESERRYHSLFENMTEGFAFCKMLFDDNDRPADFIYLDVNSSFRKITGLENVVGREVTEAIPGIKESHPELFDIYGRVALTGKPERFDIEFKPLGTWLSVSAYSIETGYFVAVFDDITERKKAEAEILKLSEDMVARNVELESVNRELEAFIYSISHDLRAPVRTIAGFARFLAEDYEDKLDDQAKDYLRRINLGSEKMTLLINDLLRLSKISRQEVERTDIDLSKLASSVISGLRASYPGRSVEVLIAGGLTAFADLRLLEIVLSNLLGNAWKFTSKTENAQIEFGVRRTEGDSIYVIRDNGAGFNPEYMEKMFWPFQRLHTEEEFEGTGIGLAIVERIIRRHSGKVWAEGEVGKGATVYFTLG